MFTIRFNTSIQTRVRRIVAAPQVTLNNLKRSLYYVPPETDQTGDVLAL